MLFYLVVGGTELCDLCLVYLCQNVNFVLQNK